MNKTIAWLLCLAAFAAAFSIPAPDVFAEDGVGDNLLLGLDYVLSCNAFQPGFADTNPPSRLTDGVRRGDGSTEWNGGKGVNGVTVETKGARKDTEIDFAFDRPVFPDTLVIKNAQAFFLDNSCDRHCRVREIQISSDGFSFRSVSFGEPVYRAIESAPKLKARDDTCGPQFFDIEICLSGAKNIEVMGLKIFCDTQRPDGSYAYVCHFDEIEAYGSDTAAPSAFTVDFIDWDGTTLDTQSVKAGTDAVPPPDPTRIGFTFTGWKGSFTNVTDNRTVTARYKINEYKVTYNINGEYYATEIYEYGAPVTAPEYDGSKGSIFSGWQLPAAMPDCDVVLDATAAFDFLSGDVTGDGLADNLDAAQILKYDSDIISASELLLRAGDVTGDGKVDNMDAAKILQYDAGLIDALSTSPPNRCF